MSTSRGDSAIVYRHRVAIDKMIATLKHTSYVASERRSAAGVITIDRVQSSIDTLVEKAHLKASNAARVVMGDMLLEYSPEEGYNRNGDLYDFGIIKNEAIEYTCDVAARAVHLYISALGIVRVEDRKANTSSEQLRKRILDRLILDDTQSTDFYFQVYIDAVDAYATDINRLWYENGAEEYVERIKTESHRIGLKAGNVYTSTFREIVTEALRPTVPAAAGGPFTAPLPAAAGGPFTTPLRVATPLPVPAPLPAAAGGPAPVVYNFGPQPPTHILSLYGPNGAQMIPNPAYPRGGDINYKNKAEKYKLKLLN